MFEAPQPQSPLAHWAIPAQRRDGKPYGVSLKESAFQVHLNLRGSPTCPTFVKTVEETIGIVLPVQPNTVSRKQGLIVAWLGPDEWLLLGVTDATGTLKVRLEVALNGMHYALNELSGGQTVITVSGPHSLDVLSKGCTLDLHPRVFGPSQCAQSQLAKASALIIPRASNLSAFDLIVRRSFAEYLWRWLIKSGSEFGVGAG